MQVCSHQRAMSALTITKDKLVHLFAGRKWGWQNGTNCKFVQGTYGAYIQVSEASLPTKKLRKLILRV